MDVEGRSGRQVGRIQSCSDLVETTIVETVEIVEETSLEEVVEEVAEEVAEEVVEEVVVVTIMEDPVASAHLKHSTTMDRPTETVEGIAKVLFYGALNILNPLAETRPGAPGATLQVGIVGVETCTAHPGL